MNFIELIEKENHRLFGDLQSTNIYNQLAYDYYKEYVSTNYNSDISTFYKEFKQGLFNRIKLINQHDKKIASPIERNISPVEFGEIVAEIIIYKNNHNISYRE